MICVIGSHSLIAHGVDMGRKPLDLDLVCTYDELMEYAKRHYQNVAETYPIAEGKKWVIKGRRKMESIPSNIIEAELAWDNSNAKALVDLILADKDTIFKDGMAFASKHVCYMLKMSHRYLRNSPHFLKTMRDIHTLRAAGAKIKKAHKEFYKERMRVTYYYKHPSLMQGKMSFFADDGIKYHFDHDSIHESVKLGDLPAYSYFQTDGAEVMCDMDKFFKIDEQIRLNAVCEESMVLALERSIVPFGTDYRKAYEMALKKVCSSITSGRFREYAWENFDKALAMFDEKIFDRFFQHVMEEKVDLAKKAA